MEGQDLKNEASQQAAATAAAPSSAIGNANDNSSAASSAAPPQRISRRAISAPAASAPPSAAASTSAASSGPPRVIARPPINVYHRVAIIRDDSDVVVCEDPDRPGTRKEIVMGHLKESSKGDEKKSAKAATTKKESDIESESNNNANKKEIPVPTITTVKRYDTDVPPNYDMPTSYVRNVCPTYDEVDATVEYNLDVEDEAWWRENKDFGPYAKAKIILGGDDNTEQVIPKNDSPTTQQAGGGQAEKEAGSSKPKKEVTRSKKGKFIKKSSSKSILKDIKEDAMEIDESTSNEALSPLSSPKHNLTIDQVILLNPKYLHSRHSTRTLLQRYNPKLPLQLFEQMMDILEKATGFEFVVTNQKAEEILDRKIPKLIDIFGPMSAKDRSREVEEDERYLTRWLKPEEITAKVDRFGKPYPTLGQPVTLPVVIQQVYNYWTSKRSKLKKPLLRRYWPPTAASDLNPHQVFRQRDKEKRRLRKKKQNDMEAYRKMKQLKHDFTKVKVLCDLIIQRENVNATMVEVTNDYFEERLHGFVDTSGLPRQSKLNEQMIERVLNGPRYFDDGPIIKMKGGKKRKRTQMGWAVDSRDPSPVPPISGGLVSSAGGTLHPPHPSIAGIPHHHAMKPPPLSIPQQPAQPQPSRILPKAGHDGGLPAPNFLQPLPTRESHHVTSWDDAVPSISSYVDGKRTTQPNKFRHRPRLGRGGRIIIDRVPCPMPQSAGLGVVAPSPPPTVITYGTPMKRSGYDIYTLGADGPHYSINCSPGKLCNPANTEGTGTNAKTAPKAPPAMCLEDLLPKPLGDTTLLSRRIEEICALGLMEDVQAKIGVTPAASAVSTSVASSKSGGGNATSSVATLSEEIDEVLVPIEDWMEAPEDMQIYGSEKFVIGPL